MKHQALLATLILTSGSLLLQPAFADEAHHPDQKAGQKAATAAPVADQTLSKMQANTKKMQTQLEQVAKSKDPKARQQLMQEHMKTMQESMAMGKGMAGGMACPMMSGGMEGGMGMMGGGQGGMGPEAMMSRMQMMEKRMDVMQTMMEQMSKQPAPAK